jgi:hypothetical protein
MSMPETVELQHEHLRHVGGDGSRTVLAPQPFAQTLEPWVRVQVVEHWQHDVLGQ